MEGSESDPGERRPTMADVARRAGVSRATVSFVVNDTPGQSIGMQTRRRVLDAVEALSYRPNRAAQGLRTHRSATIGFVTHETPERSFADPAITGAHDVADEFGSRLVLVTTGRSPVRLRAALDDLIDRQVDAIIVATSGTRAITLPDAVRSRPTVLVNCFEGEAGRPSVPTLPTRLTTLLPDEQAGGHAAARVALDAGHRNFAFLAGKADSWATVERVAGYRTALTAAGVDPRRQLLAHGRYEIDAGHDLARALIATRPLPTVILCGNDRMAVGVLLALGQAGIQVPDEVSVIGYDDQFALAASVRPALTTVRLPYVEMGRAAATHLLCPDRHLAPTAPQWLPCPVVVRDSLGPPRAVP
ncbi:MAG: LacI family transcriptional regulator [Humibacillus sp.]|nr:LacI family transcriptional regulator [Humibacillus sp.]MDN5780117.1 LacI family transcriptional regulator [Humibacillus sp.]